MVQDKRLIAIINGNSSFGNQLDGRREWDFLQSPLGPDGYSAVAWLSTRARDWLSSKRLYGLPAAPEKPYCL